MIKLGKKMLKKMDVDLEVLELVTRLWRRGGGK